VNAVKVGADIPRRYRDVKPCPRCGIERRTHPSRTGLCRDCAPITTKETSND
jgi:NMD protein affecting ribosome stability and mRNA decay